MNRKLFALAFAITAVSGFAADRYATTQISIDQPLHIPGAVLAPGSYAVQLEDRMYDRAIVKITGPNATEHLIVAVPNRKLAPGGGRAHLVVKGEGGDQYARGFVCPGCGSALEFAYPKLEAVTLAKASSKPVLAIDPESDKLPAAASLTATDMKVVNLWMLTPSRVTPDADVQIAAAHYQAPAGAGQEMAQTTPPASPQAADSATAPAPETPKRLPSTASNDFNFAALGVTALLAAIGLGWVRRRRIV